MKNPLNSKTILFFLLTILAVILNGILNKQEADTFSLLTADWKAIVIAVGGIILRFFTSKPLKL